LLKERQGQWELKWNNLLTSEASVAPSVTFAKRNFGVSSEMEQVLTSLIDALSACCGEIFIFNLWEVFIAMRIKIVYHEKNYARKKI